MTGFNKPRKLVRLKVEGHNFSYTVALCDKIPSFTFWGKDSEVIDRLIVKSAMTEGTEQLECKFSQC